MKELLGNYDAFVARINDGLDSAGINREELAMMDHLCYRVETDQRYAELLHKFGSKARMIGEVDVNGRPIASFEFDEPIETGGWRIPYLELPAPKTGAPYPEGLEHVEFVVIGDVEKFASRHAKLPFDRKGMDKLINPEIALKTELMSVKFHEQPLGAVVRIENRLESEK